MPVDTPTLGETSQAKLQSKKTAPKLEPQQMVHWFVASSYTSGSFTEDRVKNSVELLHRVPAARFAVLHRFTSLFEEAVRAHLDKIEFHATAPGVSPEVTNSLNLTISTLLDILNKANGDAWAPILCSWSVEALGQISSSYKQRQVIPPPSNLTAMLAFWLNIPPMRMLLDVYRTCLKIMIHNNMETCVDSLLVASVSHSPHFDWVVADVGSAFPDAIIDKVLNSGYCKFCKLRWSAAAVQAIPLMSVTVNENEQSILTSVIRILEHLSNQHKSDICRVVLDMFKFPPGDDGTGKIKVTLYFMSLLSMSTMLLHATTIMFVEHIDVPTLNLLYQQYVKLQKTPDEISTLHSMIIHLVCHSNKASFQLISLIFKAACGEIKNLADGLKDTFRKIVPLFLKDLQRLALSKVNGGAPDKESIFPQLIHHYKLVCNELLSATSPDRNMWLQALLVSLCLKENASYIFSYLLAESVKSCHIELLIRIYCDVYPVIPDLLEGILFESFALLTQLSLKEKNALLSNLHRLCSFNEENFLTHVDFRDRLVKGVCSYIDELVALVGHLSSSIQLSHASLSLLVLVMSKVTHQQLRINTRLLPMTQSFVAYFYRLMHAGYVNNDLEMQNCHQALVMIAQMPDCFVVVCRFMLEGAISSYNSFLFGKCIESEPDDNGEVSLLTMHNKLATGKLSTHPNNVTSFKPIGVETGLIGNGPKRRKKCPISHVAQAANNECLSLFLYCCCCKTAGSVDIVSISLPDVGEAYDEEKLLSLATCLISSIASSSCYLSTSLTLEGDHEWPTLYVRKSTIERDLKVFHFMDEHPFVWSLLSLLSHNHQAVCTVSPLIRSCMSVLLGHFESCHGVDPPHESTLHYQVAIRIAELLGKGEMVPAPLAYSGELFRFISPYEIFLILSTLWNFIRDHPSQVDIEHGSKRDFGAENINQQPYLTSIHTILHRNVSKLGFLFSRFVIEDFRGKK